MDKRDVALEFRNITKVYPNGVVANSNVNMKVFKGEIHGLIGENGAGKSTLMKILFGTEIPEEGEIFINEEKQNIDSPSKAIKLGIGMVHQHFMLVDSLTIAENIFLGSEPTKSKFILDERNMISKAQELADKYHFNLNVKDVVEDVSVGVKQETEILKTLARGANIIILDEPTAVLTPQETEKLFAELMILKKQGHTIIFISHKLKEVKEICDNITILRHGTTVETTEVKSITPQEISNKMVGREVILKIDKSIATFGEHILEVNNINYTNSLGKDMLKNISFKVSAGEILSIAGVEGNGQSELASVLTGNLFADSGTIKLENEILDKSNVKEFREKGITYIPEDRLVSGVASNMSIADNLIAISVDDFIDNKLLSYNRIYDFSEKLINEFRVKSISPRQEVSMLSGGNIQKVVAARELSQKLKVVIAEQPTRGIDPGASELIRQKLIELRDKGAAIILISADLNEVLELSDSCIVMHNGMINAYFQETSKLTEKELGYYMLGIKSMNEVEEE